MTPADLYQRLRYQLAPVGVTTMGACAKGCGEPARGAGTCKYCLVAELAQALPGFDWATFNRKLDVSRHLILLADEAVYGGGEQ